MSAKRSRSERKKKKLAAFLEVAKLNDQDKLKKKKERESLERASCASEINSCEDAPPLKRSKEEHSQKNEGKLTNDEEICDDTVVPKLPNEDSSEPTLNELRMAARQRLNNFKKLPRFRLKEAGETASFDTPEDQRIPLFMIDVQHLIMCSLLGHHAPFDAPRWYQLLKFNKLSHTVVLVVDDVSFEDLHFATGFLHLPPNEENVSTDDHPPKELFPWRLELVGPSTYGSNLIQEMATIPLSNTQYDKIVKKFGNLEKALKGKAVYKVFRAMFPVRDVNVEVEENLDNKNTVDTKERELKGRKSDNFPRTELLLSANQMVEIGYPLPLMKCSSSDQTKQPIPIHVVESKHVGSLGELIQSQEFQKHLSEEQEKSIGETDSRQNQPDKDEPEDEFYVFTRPWYKEVGPDSPLFALDCEMCMTGKSTFELTRISVVDEDLNVVYESYVKPFRKITNYLTRFSGITADHLKNVKTRLNDVQRDIRNILPPDAILVGQSLNFDLHAMKMMHPYVIDTSVIFNLSGQRLKRSKLATLSRLFLSEEIQCWGSKGHDSIEDAAAAMKLVLLKLSKSISFGDAVLGGKLPVNEKERPKRDPRQVRLANDLGSGTENRTYATSIFSHVKRGQHSAVVVGMKDAVLEYQDYAEEGLFSRTNKICDMNSTIERNVELIPVEKAKEAIFRACEVMLNHQLCIIHLPRNSVGVKLKKLEKWCEKIVKTAAAYSLCIVILGGAQSANGACLIHLKQTTDASQ